MRKRKRIGGRVEYVPLDLIFGSYRGPITVLVDSANRAGLRYTYRKAGVGARNLYCWDVDGFDKFISNIEKRFGVTGDNSRMRGPEVRGAMLELGIDVRGLHRATGISVIKINHWLNLGGVASKVATRKIREVLNDHRKAEPQAKAGSVPHLGGVRTEMGGKVRKAVCSDRPRSRSEQGADLHPLR
jgi:hypothetical protein